MTGKPTAGGGWWIAYNCSLYIWLTFGLRKGVVFCIEILACVLLPKGEFCRCISERVIYEMIKEIENELQARLNHVTILVEEFRFSSEEVRVTIISDIDDTRINDTLEINDINYEMFCNKVALKLGLNLYRKSDNK